MTITAADISVVICAYMDERWSDLLAAIASVKHQNAPPLEIIVVIDNNPALLERVRAEVSTVVAIENTEVRGLAGSRNSGIAVARGKIIAFLDDDATAVPDWLQQLSTGYADPNVVGVGGAILPYWLTSRPAWFPEEFNWVVGCDYRGLPQMTAPVRNLVGANMSMRREIFEMVGKFRLGKVDTASRPEETELCIRTLQKLPSGIWLYEPRARVFHTVSVTRTSCRYFLTRCYHEGLGKAAMVNLVGAGDGLSAERSYLLKTLPSGVFHGIQDALVRRDLTGLGRSVAIVAGLTVTAMSYVYGRIALRLAERGRTNSSVNLSGEQS
jgi:glycosyltransferase involved in cell wall biosynthesis